MRIVSLLSCCLVASLGASSALADTGPASAAGTEPAPLTEDRTAKRAGDAVVATDSHDEEARSLFRAGVSAYEDGRYADALGHFQRAYELSDRPQMLFNIAQAADRLRMDEEALRALRAYRKRLPDADNRAQVDNRIRALEATQAGAPPGAPVATAVPAANTAGSGDNSAPSALDASMATPPQGAARDDDGDGLLSQWWFWTAAGVVVASVAIGVVVAASDDGGVADRARGTDGMVILTLGQP